jgi:hypothetical protein
MIGDIPMQADQGSKPKRRAASADKPTIWNALQLAFPWGSALRPAQSRARSRAMASPMHQERVAGDDLDREDQP